MPHFYGLPAIRFVARSLREPTPAKAARGTRAWAQRRRQPWTTDGAEGPPTRPLPELGVPHMGPQGPPEGAKGGRAHARGVGGKSNSW